MKLLRFSLSVPILTLAMLLPMRAQQEVMPDIFDSTPQQQVSPTTKSFQKHDTARRSNRRAKRIRAKTATTKLAAHPARAASTPASVERAANTARAQ
jgi:hypothetical protein